MRWELEGAGVLAIGANVPTRGSGGTPDLQSRARDPINEA